MSAPAAWLFLHLGFVGVMALWFRISSVSVSPFWRFLHSHGTSVLWTLLATLFFWGLGVLLDTYWLDTGSAGAWITGHPFTSRLAAGGSVHCMIASVALGQSKRLALFAHGEHFLPLPLCWLLYAAAGAIVFGAVGFIIDLLRAQQNGLARGSAR